MNIEKVRNGKIVEVAPAAITVAFSVPKYTLLSEVTVLKLLPVITTCVPMGPEAGEKELITGNWQNTSGALSATTVKGDHFIVQPSCVSSLGSDSMVLAGSDGLFMMVSNHIQPLAYFSNIKQEVKVEGGRYEFEFIPRCIVRTGARRYFGGWSLGWLISV